MASNCQKGREIGKVGAADLHVHPAGSAVCDRKRRIASSLKRPLVHEVLARTLRDRRAVARYAGLTGSPDESGRRRREKGLAKAGNARVRRGMIQLAWRFLLHQKGFLLHQKE